MASPPTSSNLKRAHSNPNVNNNNDKEVPEKMMNLEAKETKPSKRQEKEEEEYIPPRPRMSIYGPHFKYGPNRITAPEDDINSSDSDLSDPEDNHEEEYEDISDDPLDDEDADKSVKSPSPRP